MYIRLLPCWEPFDWCDVAKLDFVCLDGVGGVDDDVDDVDGDNDGGALPLNPGIGGGEERGKKEGEVISTDADKVVVDVF